MQTGLIEDKEQDTVESENEISNNTLATIDENLDLNQLIPLLQSLQSQLSGLLAHTIPQQVQSVPTYLIPGVTISTTLQMMLSIKLLLKQYAEEFNITQRRIVEVALIELLNKYGYDYKVKSVLSE